jgi:DNA polymerase-3 subunit epsilon
MGFLDRFRQAPGSTGLNLHFAAVDLETTGLDPVEDRVIEVAVVLFDAQGTVLDEWTTLVNPGDRGAGVVAIHGIQSDWLAAAPTFREIAGDLTDRVFGRVLVAHNHKFDLDFIEAEFRRLGLPVASDVMVVDTMNLAEQLGLPRKLTRLTQQIGIPYYPHSALDDARAVTQVLTHFLPIIGPSTFSGRLQVQPGQWPAMALSGKAVQRQQASTLTKPRSILAGAIENLPPMDLGRVANPEAGGAYLSLLEQVMEDGYVSPEERQQLLNLARSWGLSRPDIEVLHREFLDGLLDAAMEDRKLSKAERDELQRAAVWLGVEVGDLDLLTRQARARSRARIEVARAELRGRVVAFTGRGIYSSSIREGLCLKYGIQFKNGLTSDCGLLVIGSDEVENASVQKAREHGIPVIVESAFWDRLGERVPSGISW